MGQYAAVKPPTLLPLSVFENALMGFLLVHNDGTILHANVTACKALGYTVSEMTGMGLLQLFPYDVPAITGFWDASATQTSWDMVPLRKKNGRNYLADIQFARVDAATDGESGHTCLMFRESAVADAVPDLLDALPDNLFQFQGESMFRAAAELISTKLEIEYVVVGEMAAGSAQMQAKIIWGQGEFLAEETIDLSNSPYGAVALHGEFLHFGPEVGELFPYDRQIKDWNIQSYFGIPFFDSERKIIGILSVLSKKPIRRDPVIELVLRMYADRLAVEMQRSIDERALRESEERFRRLYEHSPLAIGIRDLESEEIIDVNPRMLELFGYTREEVIGLNRGATTVTEDDQLRVAFSEQLIKGEIPRFSTEKIYRTKSGAEIYCRSTRTLMRIQDKEYMVGTLEDITREKLVEAELREKIRELDQKNQQLSEYIDSNVQLESFAYFASHDLKEPLRTIGSFSQLLKRRYHDTLDQDGREYIDFIVQGVQSMNRLISDLLSFARVNRKDHVWEKINPRHLVREVIVDLDRMVSDTGAVVEIGALPDSFAGYRTNLRQLFQNLIANGIKFRQKDRPPVIRISCRPQEKGWRFEITDNGIGIDPRFQEQIFTMFRKLHSRDEYEGTGIGLALCRRVVNQHGGEISVHSIPGQGATFSFSLLNELPPYSL